jgi:hypothetical protein
VSIKNIFTVGAGGDPVVECLLGVQETLGSIPNTAKIKIKKE